MKKGIYASIDTRKKDMNKKKAVEYYAKDMLGDMMFKTVADDKIRRQNNFNESDEDLAEDFEFIDDADVFDILIH